MGNRIIKLAVADELVKRSSTLAGASGSFNAVTMEITFSPTWDGTVKTIRMTDAKGEATKTITLTSAYLKAGTTGEYQVPIPAEPLKYPGEMKLGFVGIVAAPEPSRRIIASAATTLTVMESMIPPGTDFFSDPQPA